MEGYTDWDASLQVIQQALKAVGIQINVVDENNSSVLEPNLHDGNFTLAYYFLPQSSHRGRLHEDWRRSSGLLAEGDDNGVSCLPAVRVSVMNEPI